MIRSYEPRDYEQLKELYHHSEWFGGQFDEARDRQELLAEKIQADPQSILVYERAAQLLGTISLIDDGRVGMLYRFVVRDNDLEVAKELYGRATDIFKQRGHKQVLVYTPVNDPVLHDRYAQLGMTRGSDYTCYYIQLNN